MKKVITFLFAKNFSFFEVFSFLALIALTSNVWWAMLGGVVIGVITATANRFFGD